MNRRKRSPDFKANILGGLLVHLAFVSNACAQMIAIAGIGTWACRRFFETISANPMEERECFAWAQGFMLHERHLAVHADRQDERLTLVPLSLSIPVQFAPLPAYCERSPPPSYSDGGEVLYRELGGTAVK